MKKNTTLLIIAILSGLVNALSAQSTGDYRSKQTGAWNLASTWQTYDGSGWINATASPSYSDGVITILNSHNISSGSIVIADQVVINNGGTLTITAGTFTINDGAGTDFTCGGTLLLSAGVLDGAGTLTFSSGSQCNWSGGTNGGSGIMNIDAGAALNINDADVILNGTKTINNHGTWTWTSGIFNYDGGSPIANNYGVFNIYTDADQATSAGSTGSFNNKPGGIINKIGSPGDETSFSGTISFSNEGTININSSKLKLNISSVNTGTIDADFGADMNFSAGTANFNSGTMLTGAGNFNFEGGTDIINAAVITAGNLNIIGASVTLTPVITINTGSNLNLSLGTLAGPGNITFSSGSNFNWSGGTIESTGVININAGANFNMDGTDHYLSGTKTINNYGIWTWTSGLLYYNDDAPVINNYGTFNISTDDDVEQANSNTGSLNNMSTGIINKIGSPTGETYINNINAFSNAGTINVNSGKLKLQIGSVNTGTINIAFGAHMNLAGGVINFNSGSSLAGAGYLDFESGNNNINAGTVSCNYINISGGTVDVTTNIAVNNGQNLNFTGGTLDGSGDINFNSGSIFNWSGGIHSGSGTTNINSGTTLTMDGGVHSISDTRTINNYSNWSWNGGDIYLTAGDPVINNYGTLDIVTDDDITQFNTTTDAFNNMATGIINKQGSSTEETTISNISSFNNAGAVHVLSGNFAINSTGVHNGNYEIDFGGQLSGSLLMSFTGNSVINNGIIALADLNFNGSAIQYWDGEGFIDKITIDNSIGVNLYGIQEVVTGFTIFPNSKFTVYGNLTVP